MRLLAFNDKGFGCDGKFTRFNEFERGLDMPALRREVLVGYRRKSQALNGQMRVDYGLGRADLWGFFDPQVLGNSTLIRRGGFPSLHALMLRVMVLDSILAQHPADLVECSNADFETQYILRRLCNARGQKCSCSREARQEPPNARVGRLRFYLGLRVRLRYMLGKLSRRGKPADVLVVTSERYCGSDPEQDLVFGALIKELRGRGLEVKAVKLDRFNSPTSWLNILGEPRRKYAYMGSYYTIRSMRQTFRLATKIEQACEGLWLKPQFQALFETKGVNLLPLMAEYVKYVGRATSRLVADAVISARCLVSLEMPRALVIDSEANFYGKGLMMQYPSAMALQFGPVLDSWCDIPPAASFVPALKCVGGELARRILVDTYGYPESSVKATGEPRYDYLQHQNGGRDTTLQALNLDSWRRVLLFIDGGASLEGNTEGICGQLQAALGDGQLVIKLHPSPSQAVEGAYRRAFGQNPDVRVVRDYPLPGLLAASDAVIGVGSTVLLEAIGMGKPVIMLSLGSAQGSELPFASEGSALQAQDDLAEQVMLALSDPETAAGLVRGREITLKNHLMMPQNGAASEVADLIQGLIKENEGVAADV